MDSLTLGLVDASIHATHSTFTSLPAQPQLYGGLVALVTVARAVTRPLPHADSTTPILFFN